MPSKSSLRSTKQVMLGLAPMVDDRLRKSARSLGMTLSDYVSALIRFCRDKELCRAKNAA
jgi:macrodomain Ter protein organizer (MatP/YcbG family)